MRQAPTTEARTPAEAAYLFELGKRVRRLRLIAELTQDDLGRAAGLSRSFVSLIEHGEVSIGLFRLLRIAQALDLPLAELLPDLPTPPAVRRSRRTPEETAK